MARKHLSYSQYHRRLCAKVRKLRLATGLSQDEFCAEHGFPTRTLQRIEQQNASGLTLRTIYELAEAFGQELPQFLDVKK